MTVPRRRRGQSSPAMRQAVRVVVRPVVRWVLGRMSAIEEHVTDPAERWARLKETLRQLERRRR